mgnify:CR=1 FL=1
MEYYFKPNAVRDLKKLPKSAQRRIFEKLDFYTASDNPLRFAEFLGDNALGGFRFRIGDYRVVFDVKNRKIIILKIGHRKDVYK